MKSVNLNILINKPVVDVWDYTLNSDNISKWYTSIKEEIPSEIPAKLGTKLKNRGDDINKWNYYEITEFDEHKTFTLSQIGNPYHVKYTFVPSGNTTKLEYFEWVDTGELEDPATIEPLELLKINLEQ